MPKTIHTALRRSGLPFLLLLVPFILSVGPRRSVAPDGPGQEKVSETDGLKLLSKVLDPRDVGIGDLVADLPFRDLDERAGRLSDFADARALVLIVRDVGCPISKRYGPEVARIEDAYTGRGIAFLFVNESSHNTVAEMRDEIALYGYDGRYAYDPEQIFARTLEARTTTEVFVLDAARTLVYRGAIDDQYGRGVIYPAPRNTYLRDALEDVLAGTDVRVPATFAPGCFLGVDEEEPVAAPREITYHDQVARILQASCLECHRTGGAAPFPLETYKQVRGRKGMVRYMVEERLMPPWFASDDSGPWENDHRLHDADQEALLAWIRNGTPEGDPGEAPLPRSFPTGWAIGTPDLVFELSETVELPPEGVIEYMPFVAEAVVPEDIWVERLQVLPGDPEVVHHATVTYRPPDGPSDGGFREDLLGRLVPWSRGYDGWRFLYGYLPGKGPRVYGPETARFLRKGSQIRFEMHYTPKGEPAFDRTRIGLVLAKEEPVLVAQTRMLRNFDIRIAPGAKDVRFEHRYRMPCTAVLRSLTPHMHLRGRRFLAELVLPDGTRKKLLEIPEWDPDWQFSYVLAEEVVAPQRSEILLTGWFDNSADNPNNPDPTQWVLDGQQIWDEMFMLALEWVRPRSGWQP